MLNIYVFINVSLFLHAQKQLETDISHLGEIPIKNDISHKKKKRKQVLVSNK